MSRMWKIKRDCRRARSLFYDLEKEGQLTPEDALFLSRHEESCATCRQEFASWREIRTALEGVGNVTPPPDLAAKVMARIEMLEGEPAAEVVERETAWNWRRGLAAAAVFIGLLAGSWGIAGKYFHSGPDTVIVEKDTGQAVKPGSESPADDTSVQGEAEEKKGSGGSTVVAENNANPGDSGGKSDQKAQAGATESSSGTMKQPAVAEPGEKPKLASTTPASNTRGTLTFLEKQRVLTTTMLKVSVTDVGQARGEAVKLAGTYGAEVSSEVTAQSSGHPNLILRFTADQAKASDFIGKLAALGRVETQDTSRQDVTSRFNKAYEEYQQLQVKLKEAPEEERPGIEEQIKFLEEQLKKWDEEAGKHVIILWLTS